jgi:hypothetical protein
VIVNQSRIIVGDSQLRRASRDINRDQFFRHGIKFRECGAAEKMRGSLSIPLNPFMGGGQPTIQMLSLHKHFRVDGVLAIRNEILQFERTAADFFVRMGDKPLADVANLIQPHGGAIECRFQIFILREEDAVVGVRLFF